MRLLAIDTSTEACSVALLINDKIHSQFQIVPQQHNEIILPMINQMLTKTRISLAEINAFAFGAGPGSFTGLRIAASIVQGLAYGNNKPVIPISTLAALAQGAYRLFNIPLLLPALDAKMHQIYFGIYQVNDTQKIVEPLQPDQAIAPEQMTFQILKEETSKAWVGIGSGWESYSQLLTQLSGAKSNNIQVGLYPDAQDIIPLAKDKLEKGETVKASEALPFYLLSPHWNKSKTK